MWVLPGQEPCLPHPLLHPTWGPGCASYNVLTTSPSALWGKPSGPTLTISCRMVSACSCSPSSHYTPGSRCSQGPLAGSQLDGKYLSFNCRLVPGEAVAEGSRDRGPPSAHTVACPSQSPLTQKALTPGLWGQADMSAQSLRLGDEPAEQQHRWGWGLSPPSRHHGGSLPAQHYPVVWPWMSLDSLPFGVVCTEQGYPAWPVNRGHGFPLGRLQLWRPRPGPPHWSPQTEELPSLKPARPTEPSPLQACEPQLLGAAPWRGPEGLWGA